jgi:threonine/homoserine/homoserine lactone efflux protein
MVFFPALLPAVIDIREMSVNTFIEIAAAMIVISSGVVTMYTLTAVRARRFFKNVRAVQWLNRGSGTVMAGAAVAVAGRLQ